MELDINYALAYYTTNVNIFDFQWKGFGHAIWYDARKESYHEAQERLKQIVWDEIFVQFPHLKGQEIKFIESGELPVINVSQAQSEGERTLLEINSCETIEDLHSYRITATRTAELFAAYNRKLKELQP
jgi:hypothetical protein